ncbi:GDP-mannose 4,6-dehydratase [Candidatus Woesearchaeota archaeon]|nr:GDP-mannose 4,6-dehydratase [Candidatus Woesearchaeota archaeon]
MNFKNKNILVSGGAGFIGSTLVRELLGEGSNVIILDNFTSGDVANIEEVKDELTVINGDIRDKNLSKLLSKHGIEYIFNLAAFPFIPESYDKPEEFFDVDARGVLNMMLASKEAGVRRIIQYSTSEVYGTAKYVPMDENHPTFPCSTYAVSKLAADRLCYTLHHEQEIPVIILRQFNVYGPRITQPYVIAELIKQLSKSSRLKLGNINARRDMTYVTDAARGAIELMKCNDAVGEVVNMGSGKDWSIKEMAEIAGSLMGYSSVDIEVINRRLRPLDVERLQADYSKMNRLTGWKPTTGFQEGLKKTIDWFKGNGSQWIWERKFIDEEHMWKWKNNDKE